jgi:hypothetical protein
MQKVGTLQIFEKKPKKRLWRSLFALFYFSAVKLKKKVAAGAFKAALLFDYQK